jgi:hypothetical protein
LHRDVVNFSTDVPACPLPSHEVLQAARAVPEAVELARQTGEKLGDVLTFEHETGHKVDVPAGSREAVNLAADNRWTRIKRLTSPRPPRSPPVAGASRGFRPLPV